MTWQMVVLILGILAFFAIAMAINAWQTVHTAKGSDGDK